MKWIRESTFVCWFIFCLFVCFSFLLALTGELLVFWNFELQKTPQAALLFRHSKWHHRSSVTVRLLPSARAICMHVDVGKAQNMRPNAASCGIGARHRRHTSELVIAGYVPVDSTMRLYTLVAHLATSTFSLPSWEATFWAWPAGQSLSPLPDVPCLTPAKVLFWGFATSPPLCQEGGVSRDLYVLAARSLSFVGCMRAASRF